MSFEATALGSGYYKVYVAGVKFSQHTTEREALERCSKILETDPTVDLYYIHDYKVTVVPTEDTVVFQDPDTTPPVSDSGEDLIDFLARIQNIEEPGPESVEIQANTMAEFLNESAELSKTTWLAKRLYFRVGPEDYQWIGIAWRGYFLLWYLRDVNAIRINVGSTGE